MGPIYRHDTGLGDKHPVFAGSSAKVLLYSQQTGKTALSVSALCPSRIRGNLWNTKKTVNGNAGKKKPFGWLIRDAGIGADYMRNREEIERECIGRVKDFDGRGGGRKLPEG